MKPCVSAFIVLSLASTMLWTQTGAPAQSAPAAQPDQSSTQQKHDSSECMKWAKQQVGLDQSSSSQQPSSNTNPNEPGAVPDKNTTKQPADNTQSNANSGAADATAGIAGSLGKAADSKTAHLGEAGVFTLHGK